MNCNRNQLNITRSSDVILNVTLEHEGEVIIPALIDGLEVYLISGLGKRIPLTATQASDYIVVNIPWSVVQRVSIYSLEIKGIINGLQWCSIGKGLLRYTNATEAGADNVTLQADAYDVTMEVGYHYSDSPIARVEATIDSQVGEPEVGIRYAARVLSLAFRNIKGNGIASIIKETDNTGDGAVNTWRVNLDNGQFTLLSLQNGSRGNGIASITEERSEEDGGTNTIRITLDDGTEYVVHTKNGHQGIQGIQGTSAIWDGNAEVLTKLEQTIGQATNRTMSQKAISDELLFVSRTYNPETNGTSTGNIYNGTWYSPDSSGTASSKGAGRYLNVTSRRGRMFRLVPQEGVTGAYAFVKTEYAGNGNPVEFSEGTSKYSLSSSALVTIPEDAAYLWWQTIRQGVDVKPASIEIVDTVKTGVESNKQAITENAQAINDVANTSFEVKNITIQNDKSKFNTGLIYQGRWAASQTNRRGYQFGATSYRGKTVIVTPQEGKKISFAFLTAGYSLGDDVAYCEGTTLYDGVSSVITAVVPDDCVYMWYYIVDSSTSSYSPQSISIRQIWTDTLKDCIDKVSLFGGMRWIYVNASTGDDATGSGTSSSPYATFSKALSESGDNAFIVLVGDYYGEVALNVLKNSITIFGSRGDSRARIISGTKMEGSLYNNIPDVYSWTPEDSTLLPTGSYQWLWQHDIDDESTLINVEERHPLQRRRRCRRQSTKIVHAESLEALLSATTPCWYKSSGTLYVRAVTGSDIDANPIYIPNKDTKIGLTVNSSAKVEICNLEVLYGQVNLSNSVNCRIVDCSARFTCGEGAWKWNGARNLTLIRCEADSNTMAGVTTGDGFNAHADPSASVDIHGRHTTATLIDCWSHDNRDDGYSDHGRCETTIIGGLFEYNNKGGLTPATGAHDVYYNVLCRRQSGSGIFYTVAATEGDGGSVYCNGCICVDNGDSNFKCNSGSATYPNRMTLVNCVSERGNYGYYSSSEHSKIVAHNCTDFGSQTSKSSNVVSYNGTLI